MLYTSPSLLLRLRRHFTTTQTTKHPTQQSHLLLLQSCNSHHHFNQIQAQILLTGQISNTHLATKLLEFYTISAKNMDYALRIFEHINDPGTYTWTAMIRGFVGIKNPNKAIEFYTLMRSQGVKPNKFTFLFALKAYSLIPSYHEGRAVHGELTKVGLDADMFLRNGLMQLYSKCGDIKAAYGVFEEMPSSNVVNWNTMICGCFACGNVEGARRLFDEMPDRNVESWNVLIHGYSKWGLVDVARSVFEVMPQKDLFSWSVMISCYVQSGKAGKSLELFEEMQRDGVGPDNVILVSVLSACAQIGALDVGRWIHAYVRKNKFKHDVFLGTSLVDMYAKCGCIDTALQVFNDMPWKNVCSWNAIICGLAMHGHGTDVLDLYKRMELGIEPNDITFVGVLSACNHIGSVEEGQKHFNRMCTEFGIAPKIEHYGCMVDILGRAGLINEAKALIKSMPMEPNIVVWGALLNACKMHGFTRIGEDVVNHLQKLATEDGGCYVLLSNIYAAEKQWDKVAKTRKIMRDIGVDKKMPGCSSIEVNSVVHEFLVEDKFHPEWREAYDTIDRLNLHLEVEGYVPNPSLVVFNIEEYIGYQEQNTFNHR